MGICHIKMGESEDKPHKDGNSYISEGRGRDGHDGDGVGMKKLREWDGNGDEFEYRVTVCCVAVDRFHQSLIENYGGQIITQLIV